MYEEIFFDIMAAVTNIVKIDSTYIIVLTKNYHPSINFIHMNFLHFQL